MVCYAVQALSIALLVLVLHSCALLCCLIMSHGFAHHFLPSVLILQPTPRLVSLSHVPTNGGRVYDAAGVGAACAAAGVPFLLDACQTVGQMPLDVQQLQCDFLTGEKGQVPSPWRFKRTMPLHFSWSSSAVVTIRQGSNCQARQRGKILWICLGKKLSLS